VRFTREQQMTHLVRHDVPEHAAGVSPRVSREVLNASIKRIRKSPTIPRLQREAQDVF
jgi:hypothetical protein